MKAVEASDYKVVFGDEGMDYLVSYLKENEDNITKIFFLVDSNTYDNCLAPLMEYMPEFVNAEIIEVQPGEENKNLDTCRGIWDSLTTSGADRKSLLINLGGGVVTDMGGFCASCFKRGIRFINIPTTLLSQVDASVGGKTGVDLGSIKNQIGLFANPEMVVVHTRFLATLDSRQLISGMAEMLKHGLIYDGAHWEEIVTADEINLDNLEGMIQNSVAIKNEIVRADWRETGLRKILNFGHTVGHAIETYYLESEELESLTHGEAIAAGMVVEAYLSNKFFQLPMEFVEQFKEFMSQMFGKVEWPEGAEDEFLALMKHDKKNEQEKINFSLIKKIGECSYNNYVDEELIREALAYYKA